MIIVSTDNIIRYEISIRFNKTDVFTDIKIITSVESNLLTAKMIIYKAVVKLVLRNASCRRSETGNMCNGRNGISQNT